MFSIYAQRKTIRPALLDKSGNLLLDKGGEAIDDGTNNVISLWQRETKKQAEAFMNNVAANVKKRDWKFWIQ